MQSSVDVARLPVKVEHKLRAWLIDYTNGASMTLANHALLSTDNAFAKFRAPDGALVLVAVHAIRSIKTV